jgi:hypothetical protein
MHIQGRMSGSLKMSEFPAELTREHAKDVGGVLSLAPVNSVAGVYFPGH